MHEVNVYVVEALFYLLGAFLYPLILLVERLVGEQAFEAWFNDVICASLNKWADG